MIRYHHLFADLLRGRLQRTQSQVVPELHRRAGQWYEHNEMFTQAVAHTLAAEDYDTAARLIEQAGGPLTRRGELSTLLRWIEGLPDDLVRSRPRLSLHYAWALLLTGQVKAVESRLQDLERCLADEASKVQLGETEVQDMLATVIAILQARWRHTPHRSCPRSGCLA